MCHLKTDWSSGLYFEQLPEVLFSLEEMLHDELIEITDTSLKITEKGKLTPRFSYLQDYVDGK